MSKSNRIPTINDVADVAGVSKRTVSRVINKSDLVKARTREKVEAVIRELNFSPNRQARGLASRRSFLIGLVYDVPTLHIADIQRGILNICYEEGFELVVHACHIETQNLVDEVLGFVARAKVDEEGAWVQSPLAKTVTDAFRLARAMTLKNAAAGLPHGGGKAVIVGDPLLPHEHKEPLIRAFARAIADLTEYVYRQFIVTGSAN